jgi:hypothetical protein
MNKVNRFLRRRPRASLKFEIASSFRRSARYIRPRWLVVGVVALCCWVLLAVQNGAEQVDSGWAVAVPSPLAPGAVPMTPEQHVAIRHVLEQIQPPLRKSGSTQPDQSSQSENDHSSIDLRFAVRPDQMEGWRPAGQGSSTSNQVWTPHASSPQLGPANASSKTNDEAECDCSGMPQGSAATPVQTPLPVRLPAATNAGTPLPALPTTIKEESGNGDRALESQSQNEAAGSTTANGNAITPEDSVVDEAKDGKPDTSTNTEAKPRSQAALSGPTAKAPAADIVPVNDLPPLSRQLLSLRTRVRAVLKGYYRKALNSRENDPWEAMHGMLAYGVHSRIHDGGPNGELITSVGWLCYNKPCKGQTLLYVTPAGELRAKYGVGLQGHLGQFLAMLAQCHVSPDYPIHVAGHEYTIHDLIEAEKKTCYPKSELTFKLIALQHYADLNDKWVNDQGVEWDFPRLVREELAQPIRGAACGGTHRLSGLSLTVKARLRRGEPLDGEYQRAAEFVKKYQMYAFRLQNRDGSLSTSWFRGSGDDDDINRRIKTTGHILEWLCYSLSDEELRQPQAVRAVTYLANLMYSNYDNKWETGPMCHATHALLLYDQRVFQPFDKDGEVAVYRPTPSVAKRAQSNVRRR